MMNKKILLFMLVPLILGGCNNGTTISKETKVDKDTYMVNDFESLSQLGLMKFPFPLHQDRTRMELSNQHVTSGEKSLKYYNEYGTSLEMCHYFGHFVDNDIDVSNIKSIGVDIFNDSDFDTTCTLYIYDKEDMKTIIRRDFALKKGEMNYINYPISEIVIDEESDKFNAVSLRIYTPESADYNEGVIYTFYLDNWRINMGKEATQEDIINKPILESIIEEIDALPSVENVGFEDQEKLESLASKIDDLSPNYLRFARNLDKYYEVLGAFVELINQTKIINYDNEEFLSFNEFIGAAELRPEAGVNSEVIYTSKDWNNNDCGGLTKIVFSGDLDNRFAYKSNINLARFDYVSFTVHNDTGYGIRIWLSYLNNVFIDVWPNQTINSRYRTSTVFDQSYIGVECINTTNRYLDPFSGSLYFATSFVKGRSEATLQNQITNALNTIPDANDLVNEEDYLRCLTSVTAIREILDIVEDTSLVSDEQLSNISNVELKAVTNGYSVCYNAYSNPMLPIYGQETHESESGVIDPDFGFVSISHVTRNVKGEQGFKFINSVAISPKYGGYVVFIYNPMPHDVKVFVRNTAGHKWEYWNTPDFETMASPGWNKLEIKNDTIQKLIYENYEDAELVIMAHSDDLVGDWKFSSLFGIPREI